MPLSLHKMALTSEPGELMPGQPWARIRGMGNQLRHAYDRIDLDIVWETATVWFPNPRRS
jgi:uncharacterized protein with HEPN domain